MEGIRTIGPPIHASHSNLYRNPVYAGCEQAERSGGSFGLSIVDSVQQSLEVTDVPVPEFVFAHVKNVNGDLNIDLGDGLRGNRHRAEGSVYVVPAMTEAHYQVTKGGTLTTLGIPAVETERLLDDVGLTAQAFGAFHGVLRPRPDAARLIDEMWCASERVGPDREPVARWPDDAVPGGDGRGAGTVARRGRVARGRARASGAGVRRGPPRRAVDGGGAGRRWQR